MKNELAIGLICLSVFAILCLFVVSIVALDSVSYPANFEVCHTAQGHTVCK